MNKVKSKLARFSPFFQSAMVVLIASLFVTSIVFAATTIGTSVNTGGTLTVTGETHLTGMVFATSTIYFDNATSTGALTVGGTLAATGATTLSSNLNVGGYASTTGDLIVSGGTFSLATGTATTTAGLFVGPTAGTGTTTVGIGDAGQNGCLELTKAGAWYYCMIDGAGTGMQCAAGRCN